MVSQNWKNTSKSSGNFPRPFRDLPISGGAPTPSKSRREGNAFIGFLMLVALHTALVWLGVRSLKSAEIVTWEVGVWDSLRLATLYVVWQSLSLMLWSGARKR